MSEVRKIRYLTVPYTRGRGLDVGCGMERLWPHSIGVDAMMIHGGATMAMDALDLNIFANGAMDYVFGSHIFEGWTEHEVNNGLNEWWRVLKDGGYLILYSSHDFTGKSRNVSPVKITSIMRGLGGWTMLENEMRQGTNESAFFQVYRKDTGEVQKIDPWRPHTKPTAMVIRYGGVGDMLQAASVFPGLVKQGYRVFVNTTPRGKEVLDNNPFVSGWVIQDMEQVPNAELVHHWRSFEERYDRVINLSESVEGNLLAVPGRQNHCWSNAKRRKKYGEINYLEHIHRIADVPFEPDSGFYPTEEESERAQAEAQYLKMVGEGEGSVILWCLSGSSVHKAYPWTDSVVANLLLLHKDIRIVMVGDYRCQILEDGWKDEKRVLRRSGVWTIRETLAFAMVANVVIGPETGVMNAVGFLPVPKVIMLSHSSAQNLTANWKNTYTLTPKDTPCYPCHQLHYDRTFCHTNPETHAAECAHNIPPNSVLNAIQNAIGKP